jgi:hypothetical protein
MTKLSDENIEKLESLLRKTLQSKGLPIKDHVLTPRSEELMTSNGILLADMMYDFSEFPKGFVPVNLGMEYYALIPDELAMKTLVLGQLVLD